MVMANLPSRKPNLELSDAQLAIIDSLERESVPQIAKRLAKGDRATERRLRHRLWKKIQFDTALQIGIFDRSKAHLVAGLPKAAAMQAMSAGRANRTGMLTSKLIFEATGFHNPRIQHDHSGEVTIKMD